MLLSLAAVLSVGLTLWSCSSDDNDGPENPGEENTESGGENGPGGSDGSGELVRGADIGWLTEMESKGKKFYDAEGQEGDCLEILKGVGFDAVRLRVWVDPKNKWCGLEDVVAKAERAKKLGMPVMVDFHYSDEWADPEHKKRPKSWDAYRTVTDLGKALFDHTEKVLKALKEKEIDVRWVQIGNETNNGMLGTTSQGRTTTITGLIDDQANGLKRGDNYATLNNYGCRAAKEVYPDCKVVIHFENGQKWDTLKWGLDMITQEANTRTVAEFDVLGVSIYPGEGDSNWGNWEKDVKALMTNLQSIVTTYDKDVMVCEVGCPGMDKDNAAMQTMLSTLVSKCRSMDRCLGVFYWEPECYGGWEKYGMGGFTSQGRPNVALGAFGEK